MLPKSTFQSGISLIEIVISMMVVGFVILIIANVPQAIRLVSSSNHESIAKDIVNKKVEDLRNRGFGLLANGTIPFTATDTTSPGYDSRINTLPFGSGAVVINDCPNTICTNNEQTKQVEVKVSWSDQGKIKNVDVYTLVSQGGLQ